MAESDQEKTAEPTQKKREEAATEGQVPRSQDLNAAVLLLVSAVSIGTLGPPLGRAMHDVVGAGLGFGGAAAWDANAAVAYVRLLGWKALAALALLLATFVGAAAAIGGLQARGVVSAKPLAPKFDRISPAKNAKRVLGKQGLVELVKARL